MDQNERINAVFSEENAAERYRPCEKGTAPFARILVEKAGLAQLDGPVDVFDFATGTGAVVEAIYDAVPKAKWKHLSVLGGDVSPVMINYMKARAEKAGWTGVDGRVVDGTKDFDLPKESFSHIFVSFAVFVMPGVLPKLHALLKPGGYIGITTWAELLWTDLLARCITQMKEKPYSPSSAELEQKLYQGHDWSNVNYVASQLRDAGFTKVDTLRHKFEAPCMTPKLFVETMRFPSQVVSMFWEEGKREEWLKELNGIMYKDVLENAGAEDKEVVSTFDANVGWGWKSS